MFALQKHGERRSLVRLACFILFLLLGSAQASAQSWAAKLDGRIRFYQTTELGALVVGTEKSLYAVDGETGDVLWRRKNARLDETDVAPVPGTDLVLLTFERGGKTRMEAVDVLSGESLWGTEKVRGAVMQLAADTDANLLAAVLVRDGRGRAREGFRRRPVVHLFELNTGSQLWRRELESEVEMMPAAWDGNEDVPYTLNNYRAPLFLDGRVYLFYEGVTAIDARSGKEQMRERFRVNEEGLALTEADPVMDERFIFASGRGRLRAISRASGEEVWEAKDLGLTPEMILAEGVIYVRTGGQFTQLKDGAVIERGAYGVSAIDAASGKVLWRYKGADKGITNIAVPDPRTIMIADRDDLISIDARTGKRLARIEHKVERAAFVLVNLRGETVVGGQSEIAAFDTKRGAEIWRTRHAAPGRGFLRTVGAITARAAALYFRYGGAATTVFGAGQTALRGLQLARAANSLRWSGIASRVTVPNLTALAADAARDYVTPRFASFGIASRARNVSILRQSRLPSAPSLPRPSRADVDERLLDRLDPARQLERLSRFLYRRRRLAALRGSWMYYYTDLKNGGGRGLAGVNVNTGATERAIRLNDPDDRFITDEETNLLYVSKGARLLAFSLERRE